MPHILQEDPMNIEELKAKLIEDGIESVKKIETRPERIRGAIAGFEMCRKLQSKWDFDDCLRNRQAKEVEMITDNEDLLVYWEHRMATIQIQFVYDRMKVAWTQFGLYSGPVSARAVLHINELLTEEEQREKGEEGKQIRSVQDGCEGSEKAS